MINKWRMLHQWAIQKLFLIALIATVSGCASSPNEWDGDLMPVSDTNANPNPHATGNDAMFFRKPMPHRPVKPADFWIQNCTMNGDRSYYSKTSYECEGRD